MAGRMDEYLVHQTEKPLAQVVSDHPEWQDRFYFNIHDMQGEFCAITGLGAYPNRNVMQAYLFAVHKGGHYAYFNVRPLNNDREVMRTGSLSYEIVEPQKTWRLEVADEAGGIRGSLEFAARCPLYEFSPIHWQDGGQTVVHQQHYTQAGRYGGTLTIDGETLGGLVGMRDRSWGIRDMPRVPMWIWIAAQFDDCCISAWLWETPAGELIHFDGAQVFESGEVRQFTGLEHEIELHPGTKRLRSGRFQLITAAGDKLSLGAEEIGSIFLGPMTPRWSESDGEALARADAAAFGFDEHCRFDLGGKTGYGVVEFMVTGGCRRYGIAPTRIAG